MNNNPIEAQPNHRVEEAFNAVRNLPEDEQTGFLHRVFKDEPQLRDEVVSLLKYNSPTWDPLEKGCCVSMDLSVLDDKQDLSNSPPQIEGYTNLSLLSRGGQGIVYQAIQQSTGQAVAIKILSTATPDLAQSQQRMQREIALLAKLHHANIVPVIDRGETEDGAPFFVTRFIDGKPLDEFSRQFAGNRKDLVKLCARIARALNFAHESGVVHRDLKPSNILIDAEGEPYLLDFGLAKINSFVGQSSGEESLRSVKGQFLGSVAWASPEQVDSDVAPVDRRTDIYQLGVVFYQVFSEGKFPYPVEGELLEAFYHILNTEPNMLPSNTEDEGLDELGEVIGRALCKSPTDRFATAADFADALEGVCDVHTQPDQVKANSLRPRNVLITFLLMVLLALGVFSYNYHRRGSHIATKNIEKADPDRGTSNLNKQVEMGNPTSPLEQSKAIISQPDTSDTSLETTTQYPAKPVKVVSNDAKRKDSPETTSNGNPGIVDKSQSILDLNFSAGSAPHLPNGWMGDSTVYIDHTGLTIPRGTRKEATVSSTALSVEAPWQLEIQHESQGNGRFRLTCVGERGMTIDMTVYGKRFEAAKNIREKTNVTGQRLLTLVREPERIIARLQGAKPFYFNARDFGRLTKLQFGLSNAGSGGGHVAVRSVRLSVE